MLNNLTESFELLRKNIKFNLQNIVISIIFRKRSQNNHRKKHAKPMSRNQHQTKILLVSFPATINTTITKITDLFTGIKLIISVYTICKALPSFDCPLFDFADADTAAKFLCEQVIAAGFRIGVGYTMLPSRETLL